MVHVGPVCSENRKMWSCAYLEYIPETDPKLCLLLKSLFPLLAFVKRLSLLFLHVTYFYVFKDEILPLHVVSLPLCSLGTPVEDE